MSLVRWPAWYHPKILPASFVRAAVMLASFLLAACGPDIGDACRVSTDCSAQGERLCDPTQPGGYCTIFNCEAGSCPGEAACIAFGNELSSAPGCADPYGSSRLRRTFCMLKCSGDGDCRSGYVCAQLGDPENPWRADVIEKSGRAKVCIAAFEATSSSWEETPAVCSAAPQEFDFPIYDAGAGVGGASGTGGGDAGGAGGLGSGGAASGGAASGGAGAGGMAGAGGSGGV